MQGCRIDTQLQSTSRVVARPHHSLDKPAQHNKCIVTVDRRVCHTILTLRVPNPYFLTSPGGPSSNKILHRQHRKRLPTVSQPRMCQGEDRAATCCTLPH